MAEHHWYLRALKAWWPAVVLGTLSIWVVLPMFDVQWWHSHEHVFYPVRVHEYLASWKSGALYPRWCPNLYGGYGYPFLHFYAPGVYFSGALFSTLFGVDAQVGLKLFVVAITVASTFGAYGLMRGETGRTDASFVATACYVFLPYRCTDLFARGDIAEYSAYCIIPAVIWAYRALGRSTGRRAVLAGCAAVIAHGAVLLTHTLMGMFVTELVGLYLVALVIRKRLRLAVRVGAVMTFAILTSAIYVVPAFLERKLVFIERVTQSTFTPWQNAVSFKLMREAFFTPGWPFWLGVVLWAASFAIPRTRSAARRAAIPWMIAVAMAVLMLPAVVSIWKLLPFGAEVQFPWRLLGFIGLFAALGIGVWWAELLPNRRITLLAAVLVCVPLPFLLTMQRQVVESRPVPLTPDAIRTEYTGTTIMDEYLPRRVLQPPPRPRDREAWTTSADLTVSAREIDGLHHAVEIDAAGPGEVSVAVFGFRGWRLKTIEGPAPATLRIRRPDGLIRVVVPRAGHYRIVVYFGQTPLRLAAALVSLLALLAMGPVLWLLERRLHPGDSK